MRTTTRREQRPTGTRRPSTQRLAGAGRTTSRLQPRGLPRKGARKQSMVLGILSLVAFCLFWVFVVLAANSAVAAVAHEDGRRLVASVGLGLFSFVMPILGVVLGIIGVILKNSQKVVAGIGLGLNGMLVLYILLNMFSRH
jgi:hypothetical protein